MNRLRCVSVAAICVLAAVGALGAVPGAHYLVVSNFGDMDAVIFNHTRHAEENDCAVCHHPNRSEGAHRCAACHLDEPNGPVMKIEDAAHREGVGKCWACHFSKRAQKKLDCDDCHRGSP
jgi:hypothetical protein